MPPDAGVHIVPDFSVFVSSTTHDLASYREAVIRAIASVRIFHTVTQENFGISPAAPLAHCIKLVQEADLYIGLFAHYRGWEAEGDIAQRSITEIEYDTAVKAGKPIFAIVAPRDFKVRADLVGTDAERERQARFLARVRSNHIISFDWSAPDRAATVILTSILNYVLSEKLTTLAETRDEKIASSKSEQINNALSEISHTVALNYDKLFSLNSKSALARIEDSVCTALSHAKTAPQKATLLKLLGDLFFLIDSEKSKSYYQQFLSSNSDDAFVINRIGLLYSREGNSAAALTHFNKVRELHGVEKSATLSALQNSGGEYAMIGDFLSAERCASEAMQIATELGDPTTTAATYTILSLISLRMHNLVKALEHAERAYQMELASGNYVGASHDINNIASIHFSSDKYQEAITIGMRALELNTEVGRSLGIGIAHWNLFQAYFKTERLELALSHGREAAKSFIEANNLYKAAITYRFLATISVQQEQSAHAIDYFQAAERTFKKIGNATEAIEVGFLAGACMCNAGKEKDAIRYCDELLRSGLAKVESSEKLRMCYEAYCTELIARRKTQVAIRVLRKIGTRFASKEMPHERRNIEMLMGRIYLKDEKYDRARNTFAKIEQRDEPFADELERAGFLGNFGTALAFTGHPQDGYDKIKESVDIFERHRDRRGLATNYTNLVAVCVALGRLDDAARFHGLAVKYEHEVGTKGLHPADAKNWDVISALTRTR